MQHPEQHPASDVVEHFTPVRRLRIAKGLNQSELARRTNLDRVTIGRLERGETKPHPATALLIAAALGCRPAELTEGADG